ncbi:hypothetical protein HAX54_046541, partial [Datura stramonium]|nr:hypothetical protein [Datura stramonium]
SYCYMMPPKGKKRQTPPPDILSNLPDSLEDDGDEDISALECLEMEAFSDVTFDHVRKVKLLNIMGSMSEMQLIKLTLAKAPMLARIQIYPSIFVEESATIKIISELMKFQRAYLEVEVVCTLQ